MPDLVIVADDLSGAAEAAATFLLRTTRITISLDVMADTHLMPGIVAVDTHSRRRDPRDAARLATAAVAGLAGVPIIKKVDSLLRGNIAAEVGALTAALDAARPGAHGVAPVVATALPAAGRTVVDGVPHVHGVPLHATTLWDAERNPPPHTVAAALHPLPTATIPLGTVRGGTGALATCLRDAQASGTVAVCDAETDDDLDAIHAAATRLAPGAPLVGSAGLCAAAARAYPRGDVPVTPLTCADAVLIVAGSAAPSLDAQLLALAADTDALLRLDPHALLRDPAGAARETTGLLRHTRHGVVTLRRTPVDPDLSGPLVDALARAVAPSAADGRALILTGGETARTVLDLLGIDRLRPSHTDGGAVVSSTDTGQVVVTRPGSFGTPGSLAALARALTSKEPA
ncbi:four-carbon acid sugar kinase family protein [Catenuloplanes japonicus]|uniref:four-carbon acid sugar kinase family protein n=1 Tax=Catenuloplanes japonicus TaxID=33876 RepID=UPI00069189F3|nr:four-carbon acid sugar kinase family protein [Catenuloplanes japonicus]